MADMKRDWNYLRDAVSTHPFNFFTLVIALAAAALSGWAAGEAHKTRMDSENAARAQAQDVERSRTAAESSASAAKTLAETAMKSLSMTDRSARAAETSARSAGQLVTQVGRSATAEEGLTKAIVRGQSAYLATRIEILPTASSKDWGSDRSRKLWLENGTDNPAINIDVAWEVHTIGSRMGELLFWKLPDPQESIAETTQSSL